MFDAQSLLGGLLKQVVSGNKLGGDLSSKASLGMGALGVAIAAFEHFSQNNQSKHQNSMANTRPTPPPSPSPAPAARTSVPPPPPLPKAPDAQAETQKTALVLIDAMLSAANADGYIDQQEQDKIFQQLQNINSDQEGYDYVRQRMAQPPTLQQICRSTSDPELAKQIYAVSLLAITVDTPEEAEHLRQLANCLPVDAQTIAQLNEQLLSKE